jgi:phage terminase large subunit
MISPDVIATLDRARLERLYSRIVLKQLEAENATRVARPKRPRPEIPDKFAFLNEPAPVKIARGGRGSAKSQSFARVLAHAAEDHYERVLCTREFQNSIKDSVHQVIKQEIADLGMASAFVVTDREIRCPRTGSEFIFKGLHFHPEEAKSLEGVTKTWVEEGQTLTEDGVKILLPTIFRTKGAELWISYNPELSNSPVEKLVNEPIEGSIISELLTWRDNPWFPEGLELIRHREEEMAKSLGDWADYDWIWEGKFRTQSEALVFWRRIAVEDFETPPDARFFHGADWGFADDPTCLIRCYMTGNDVHGRHLWIDREAYGYRTDIDEIPALFDQIPTSKRRPGHPGWPIKGDAARPETIHYLAQRGYAITAAKKWAGSVEDGVAFLKGFVKIHVHPSCVRLIEETKRYSYKVDPKQIDPTTGKPVILPVIIDAWNHGIDSIRYALDDYIHGKHPLLISDETLARSRVPMYMGRGY